MFRRCNHHHYRSRCIYEYLFCMRFFLRSVRSVSPGHLRQKVRYVLVFRRMLLTEWYIPSCRWSSSCMSMCGGNLCNYFWFCSVCLCYSHISGIAMLFFSLLYRILLLYMYISVFGSPSPWKVLLSIMSWFSLFDTGLVHFHSGIFCV